GEDHHGGEHPTGVEQEERAIDGMRVGEEEGALAEIIDGEGGKADGKPGHLDRAPAEMAEIGVKRFRAGHHKEHGAESEKPDQAVGEKEAHPVQRIESGEHGWSLCDVPSTAESESDEPHDRYGSEEGGDTSRAVRLHREQGK